MVMLPEDMDIPFIRRDINDPANVRWLLRNLGVRNSRHPEFNVVVCMLKELAKKSTA